MIRPWLWLILLSPLLAAIPARAQQKLAPAVPAGLSQEQARVALDTLNDPKKRAAFTATLEALLKAEHGPALVPDPPPRPEKTGVESLAIPLAPDSLGAQLLLTAASFLTDMADDVVEAAKAIQSIPLLWAWVTVMLTNPLGQRLLTEAAWRLAVALIVAGVVWLALRRAMRPALSRVQQTGRRMSPEPDDEDPQARAEIGATEPPPIPALEGFPRRLRLGLTRFVLEIVPSLGLFVAGHLVAASSLGGGTDSRLVILAVIDAILISQMLLALTTLLFMPDPRGLKLLPLRHAVGSYLMRWGRRLILIGVPGNTIGEVGLLLGLSASAHDAVQKTVGLILVLGLATMIVQRRRQIRILLSAAPGADGTTARLRNRLAKLWHWPALFFLVAVWFSWTLKAPDAIALSLRYLGATAAILVAGGLARAIVAGMLGRVETTLAEGKDHSFRARFGAYHPAILRLVRLAIDALTILALLQFFGLGGLTWLLTSDVGHRLASGFGTIAVTIALAFAVWEGVNIAIQLHLETLRREAQAARSARLRTLLPLIRTSLAIAVTVVSGLMVLSEVGVNIAPLLAGAGIVGVAIGLGAQKLVQDVITGVFLLLENTMQVGDVVRVGDQVGIVESLSVRTIRLRTEDGSVVVIPFSAVTTVINMTRDFSRAVISVSVSMEEDVDRVVDAMKGIVREMRDEDAWSSIVLDDLEVWGLDKFTDSALLIKCRVMCTPFGRWPVGREFNRRMKTRFAELKIEMPYPHLKLVMDTPVPPGMILPPGTGLSLR